MAKRSTTKKPTLEELYGDVDRAWDCSNCGTPLAVATVGLYCTECRQMQKRLLTIEEAGATLQMTLELFNKRVRRDVKGNVLEEFIDVKDLLRAWKAIERLNLGN